MWEEPPTWAHLGPENHNSNATIAVIIEPTFIYRVLLVISLHTCIISLSVAPAHKADVTMLNSHVRLASFCSAWMEITSRQTVVLVWVDPG
jgi:hypothetical protein